MTSRLTFADPRSSAKTGTTYYHRLSEIGGICRSSCDRSIHSVTDILNVTNFRRMCYRGECHTLCRRPGCKCTREFRVLSYANAQQTDNVDNKQDKVVGGKQSRLTASMNVLNVIGSPHYWHPSPFHNDPVASLVSQAQPPDKPLCQANQRKTHPTTKRGRSGGSAQLLLCRSLFFEVAASRKSKDVLHPFSLPSTNT